MEFNLCHEEEFLFLVQYLSIMDKLHQRMFRPCMNDLPQCAYL